MQSTYDSFRGHIFVIGAMKAGTTTLHFALRQHPEILAGGSKELNFFIKQPAESDTLYSEQFTNLDPERHIYTLDSSPNYTKPQFERDCARRIASLDGDKKLIYLMRDPVDRIDAHIAHNVQKGPIALDAAKVSYLLDVSSYAARIGCYEAAGLLPSIKLVNFADLRDRQQETLDDVCKFLRIGPIDGLAVRPKKRRKVKKRYVDGDLAAMLRAKLRFDIEVLYERYGFAPALEWLQSDS